MDALREDKIDAALKACEGIAVTAEAVDAIGDLNTDERTMMKLVLARTGGAPKRRTRKKRGATA